MSTGTAAVGARLREALAWRAMSVASVAARLRVRETQVARWEAGKNLPPGTLVGALARAIGVPQGWLMSGEGPHPFASPAARDRLAAALHAARVSCGLKTDDIERALDLAPGTAAGFELKTHLPVPDQIHRLAELLRVPAGALWVGLPAPGN